MGPQGVTTMSTGPLQGLRVIDLTNDLGRFATKLLAETGASVVRLGSGTSGPAMRDAAAAARGGVLDWWYDGGKQPDVTVSPHYPKDKDLPKSGSMIIGEDGTLVLPHIGDPHLYPDEKFKGYAKPELEPKDHYHEFVDCCLNGGKPGANFDFAGPLAEAVLLADRMKPAEAAWEVDAATPLPPCRFYAWCCLCFQQLTCFLLQFYPGMFHELFADLPDDAVKGAPCAARALQSAAAPSAGH